MAAINPSNTTLSMHDLLIKYTGRDLLGEMPRVVILNISDKILATSEALNSDSIAMAESILLDLPMESVVLIFEKLPQCYRPNLAMACKGLARLAKTQGLLALDPTTSRLLDGVKLRKIENGPSLK